ncbi:lipoyl protein ligase domain-containing protein [Halocatena pleomorpha]|uniref:Lipoate--protein ligase family protein n=1 Tax=Halocatena pleomorpha TaxID=1785090 RepID=A0A3P3R6A1_9EURY|nr:lipoate--protein ligase family protein [Halocatena pleomorpha]RRJ28904.1 lipoate--protein ligase family protein [Halocatena pleomorpha]
MRVLRGRGETIEDDRSYTRELLQTTRETGESGVRVWRPHRQIAFGRRDTHENGYEAARVTASDHGYPPTERPVGGRAVAYTGSTVAFARSKRIDDIRTGLQSRYSAVTTDIQVALSRVGVTAAPGEPDDSFCPGSHSLQATGKIVGIAQRVRKDAALVSGIVIVRDHAAIAAVLGDVYDALGLPFAPDSVGSVARAGGPSDPQAVIHEIEQALAGDDPTIEQI